MPCWDPDLLGVFLRQDNLRLRNSKERKMNVLWIVNTNTLLLVILVIMISYLTMQINAVIRFLKRE